MTTRPTGMEFDYVMKAPIYYHTVVSSLSLNIEYIFVVAAVVVQSTSCI